MKKRNKTFILLIICTIITIFSIRYVNADSGWDYDYDSGSSWDSDWDYDYDSGSSWDSDWGSSWDNDYHSSYNGSYGTGNTTLAEFFQILTIITIVIAVVCSLKKKPLKKYERIYIDKSTSYFKFNDQQVMEKLGISPSEFNQKAFDIYKEIQNAWMEFDYEKLHKYTTDEIYNSYVMQLDALKLKKQKNIMTSIECINSKIYNIKEENGILTIEVYMNIRMFDYVVDNNNEVVRGTNTRKVNVEYELTFVKSNKKTSKKSTICPNCGAKIPATARGKCEYCGSVVVIDAKNYVMSKKTCINQRVE